MINNDAQLEVVREQLALAEHALKALREQVKNRRNFAVFSEGYVDQIADLKADIDAYRKKAKAASKPAAKKKPGKREKV
jgi:hypothetical protein